MPTWSDRPEADGCEPSPLERAGTAGSPHRTARTTSYAGDGGSGREVRFGDSGSIKDNVVPCSRPPRSLDFSGRGPRPRFPRRRPGSRIGQSRRSILCAMPLEIDPRGRRPTQRYSPRGTVDSHCGRHLGEVPSAVGAGARAARDGGVGAARRVADRSVWLTNLGGNPEAWGDGRIHHAVRQADR